MNSLKAKKRKSKRNRRRIFIAASIVLVLIIGIVGFLASRNKNAYYQIDSRVNNVESMHQEYEEVIGWLKVQGTNIDYPIIDFSTASIDNLEYDFVWKGDGTTELTDKDTIIGHNILNVSKDPLITNPNHVRFEQLMSFLYYDFAKENEYIQYTIGGEDYLYKIYAVTFSDTDEEYEYEDLSDRKKKNEYIEQVKKNSLFDYDVDVNEEDHLISLVTCTRMFGSENTDVKFKVEGRLVRKNEKTDQYDVKTSDDYDNILGGSLL